MEIKRWDNQEVIHSGNFDSVKECLEDGVKKGISFCRADLKSVNLYKADLRGADIARADFTGANLMGVNLRGANLVESDLYGVDFYKANLTGSKLSGANLKEVNLWDCKGNRKEIKNISIFWKYKVVYTKDIQQIGCEGHLIEDWKGFSDEIIFKMDGQKGLKFWHRNKEYIFNKIEEDPAL